MKKNQNTLKENLATTAASAIGAMAGVAGANAFNANAAETEPESNDPDSDDEAEVIEGTLVDNEVTADMADSAVETTENAAQPQPHPIAHGGGGSHAHRSETDNHDTEPKPVEPKTEEPVKVEPPHEPEVEVLSYERITTDDGSQLDEAVVRVDGTLVVYADINLDGYADVMAADLNHDGQIDLETEAAVVQGEGISMQPFANATGFTPDLAENHLPDYVDEADTGDFMA